MHKNYTVEGITDVGRMPFFVGTTGTWEKDRRRKKVFPSILETKIFLTQNMHLFNGMTVVVRGPLGGVYLMRQESVSPLPMRPDFWRAS